MPLYEYRCTDCENRFERIEKASALHDGTCPECGGPARRLIGTPALKFKGSGWYVNDYGKGNGSRSTATEKAADSTAESSSKTPASSEKDSSKKTTTEASSQVA